MVNEKVELVKLLEMDQDTCGFCKDTLEQSELASLTFTDIGVKGDPIQDVVRYCNAARSVGMTNDAAKAFLFRMANVARMELLCNTHRKACQVYLPSKVNEDGGVEPQLLHVVPRDSVIYRHLSVVGRKQKEDTSSTV